MRRFPTFGPEQQLVDVLYDFQALHEMAGAEAEPAIIADQLLDGALVFNDLKTGNRITMSALPRSSDEFVGATVAFHGLGEALSLHELEPPEQEEREVVFIIASDGQVFRSQENQQLCWRRYSAAALAHLLDVPQTKPAARSEYDPREAPPIIEGQIPVWDTPKILLEYFSKAVDADLLRVPADRLYTTLAAMFDGREESEHEVRPFNEPLRINGFINLYKSDWLFQLEARGITDLATELNSLDFDRRFVFTFSSLDRPLAFGGYKLGVPQTPENIELIKGSEFGFTLTREGLLMDGKLHGRSIKLVPHEHTINAMYLALLVGETFQDS